MPELPDIDLYVEKLDERINGETLEELRVFKPFLLRTVVPPVADAAGRTVVETRRLGKRVVIGLEGDYWLILHLMIAGRLQWKPIGPGKPARNHLAVLRFSSGTLLLTEAGTKQRASLYFVHGRQNLEQHDPGGIEPLACHFPKFVAALQRENRTLKRALTNPRAFSGIGNAYSDEILHAARLSPIKHTQKLDDAELRRLYTAMQSVLDEWSCRLRTEAGAEFPSKVTAFREGMAVHGRFGKPCPVCEAPVQRIRYKSNETNYCARCQTGGTILADRSLSRLLKNDWPGVLEE
jgi:formamidopyrimidine-DNA glycosylase